MHASSLVLNGVKVFEVPAQGPELRSGRDAVDLISVASAERAALILIPVQRFGDEFFDLRTQTAGEIAQKFSMYGARVAILGNICQRIAKSKSLAAFVSEANRGDCIWFVENIEELRRRLFEQRLASQASESNGPNSESR